MRIIKYMMLILTISSFSIQAMEENFLGAIPQSQYGDTTIGKGLISFISTIARLPYTTWAKRTVEKTHYTINGMPPYSSTHNLRYLSLGVGMGAFLMFAIAHIKHKHIIKPNTKNKYLQAIRAASYLGVGALTLYVAYKTGYEAYRRPLKAGVVENALIDIPAYVKPYNWIINVSYWTSAILLFNGLWHATEFIYSS